MAKKQYSSLITILLIILIGIISTIIIINRGGEEPTPTNVVECIGEKSVLYIQLGCRACEAQEELFGEDYEKLSVVDCYKDNQRCIINNITKTPTWIINNEKIIGVKSIEELKELTGCE